MEELHLPEKRSWIYKKINIKLFTDKFHTSLANYNLRDKQSILTEEEFKEFEASHTLEICPEVKDHRYSRNFEYPEDLDLLTLLTQKRDLDQRNASVKYENIVYQSYKTYNYPPIKIAGAEHANDLPLSPVDQPEIILTVQIFRPEKRASPYSRNLLSRLPSFKIESEFMVLGSQYLWELRDKIECVSDKAIPVDVSDCPKMKITTTCKDLYKSGFFYIDGVIYNDMRDPDCRDTSQNIIEWSAGDSPGVEILRKGSMERTKFKDLAFRLGYPYVYVHQGNCEHFLVFSDQRLMSRHDVQNKNAYPMLVSLRHGKRVFCMVCRIFNAKWVVLGNQRLPETPFMFCNKCFFAFNYDSNKEKIGQFRAYHFIDRSMLNI